MSCVAAVVDKGVVFMAADSFLGTDSYVIPRAPSDGKLFRHPSGLMLGWAGSASLSQNAQSFVLPGREQKQSLEEYVIRTLCPGLWNHIGSGSDVSAEVLLGIEGRLFRAFTNHVIVEAVEGFSAIGSGGSYALGSLATSLDEPPARRVKRAVQIAERYTPTVRSPVITLRGKARTTIPPAPDSKLDLHEAKLTKMQMERQVKDVA